MENKYINILLPALFFICLSTVHFACSTSHCFPSGTLISTPNGQRPIETLKVGDFVYSWSHKQKKLEVSTINSIYRSYLRLYRGIQTDDGSALFSTGEHPIYSSLHQKYIPFSSISAGFSVTQLEMAKGVNISGNTKKRIVQGYLSRGIGTVYNLSVSKNSNYFAQGLLVHNKSTPSPGVFKTNIPNNTLFIELQKGVTETRQIILLSEFSKSIINSMSLTGEDANRFTLMPSLHVPVTLKPSGESLKLKVNCLADKAGEFSAVIHIQGSATIKIHLSMTVK